MGKRSLGRQLCVWFIRTIFDASGVGVILYKFPLKLTGETYTKLRNEVCSLLHATTGLVSQMQSLSHRKKHSSSHKAFVTSLTSPSPPQLACGLTYCRSCHSSPPAPRPCSVGRSGAAERRAGTPADSAAARSRSACPDGAAETLQTTARSRSGCRTQWQR